MSFRAHLRGCSVRGYLLAGMLFGACSAAPTGASTDHIDTLADATPLDTLAPPRWNGVLLFEGPDATILMSDLASGVTTTIASGRSPGALSDVGIALVDGLVLIDSVARQLVIARGGVREIIYDGGGDYSLFDAQVSHDAERIAVTQLEPGTLRPRTHIIARDGRVLATIDDAASPAWLVDGRLVVAGSFRYPYAADAPIETPAEDGLFIVDSAMTSVARLTIDVARGLNPASSPEGGRIAFELDGDIWVVNTNGEGLRRVTSGAYRESHPVWSPDGAHIACISSDPSTPSAIGMIAIVDAFPTAPTPIDETRAIWPITGMRSTSPTDRLRAAGSLSWH